MNFKNVKLKWGWCKIMCQVSTTFWALETIFFLFKYGWHWKAFTEDEKICDKIVGGGWSIALIIFGLVLIDIVNYLLSKQRN